MVELTIEDITMTIKPFSPQGNYLLDHKKNRVWRKHWNIKNRVGEDPKFYKGQKIYFYGYRDNQIVFSARSRREGLFALSLYKAMDLRNIESTIVQ